ncbi:MAG TPA: hypothetical protein VG649_22930 [Candidatus Angelobacter sp.]|jgi:hypothetical protein|nr:hypothetical protein [Candidatus Angelobacter sp.]
MAAVFRYLAGLIVIAIAVLQFKPTIFTTTVGRWLVLALALVAAVCLGLGELFSWRADKQWRKGQTERDKKLVQAVVAELSASKVSEIVTTPIELGLNPDDPRIYLDIKEGSDAMFHETPFVLDNQGKDTAHAVHIHSLRLNRKQVNFPSVEVVAAGTKKETLPTIENVGAMQQHDIFHWLLKDWDANADAPLVDEWPIPITLNYSDFSRKKNFEVTMKLVFHPIRYLLEKDREWPPHDRILWEFRDIEFKRVA